MFFGERHAFTGSDIAKEKEHGVIRHVIRFEKGLNITEVGGIEVGEVAIEIVGVGPITERNGRHVEPGKSAIGLVHDVDADFFFDDVALIFQVFVVDFQSAHAVGLEPKHALEGIGWNGFVIICDSVAG